MDSTEWRERRRAWHAEWVERHGIDPVCRVCDAPWTLLHGDLHHASYARLGDERFTDLVPLCRADHCALHDILDTAVGWHRLGRPAATAGIVAILRRLRHADADRGGRLW